MSRSPKHRRALLDLTEVAYAPASDDTAWLRAIFEAAEPMLDAGHGLIGYFVDANRGRIDGIIGDAHLAEAVVPMHVARGSAAFDIYRQPRAVALRHDLGQQAKVATSEFVGPDVGDIWGVVCTDATGCGIVLTGPQGKRGRLPLGMKAWTMAAAHVAAAYRLRVRKGSDDAILSRDGKLLHCEAAVEPRRESLAAAVKASLEARRSAWQSGDDAALEAWRVLTDGRWSVVERTDTDGKHLLIAKRNPLPVADVEPLDDVERQICAMIAAGHSQKLVAYELGFHPSAVGRRLQRALVKLGLRSAAELAHAFAWLPPSVAHAQGKRD